VRRFDSTFLIDSVRGRVDARDAPLVGYDLLVAATVRHHRGILVSRYSVLSMVPGLAVEVY
jgi:predicted nucleic acid-binding protein